MEILKRQRQIETVMPFLLCAKLSHVHYLQKKQSIIKEILLFSFFYFDNNLHITSLYVDKLNQHDRGNFTHNMILWKTHFIIVRVIVYYK